MRALGGEEWAGWLRERGLVALDGIDTRSLVLHLRERGAMRAALVADEDDARGRGRPRAGARAAGDGGPGARRPGFDALSRTRSGSADAARRARRLRHEALDRAPPRRRWSSGHGRPAHDERRRARRLRRRGALERPRRPRAARRRDPGRARAARSRPAPRDLPRSPAPRARDGAHDLQAPLRPPRREPPGSRARQRARARDEPEPRLRGRALRRARGDPRLALRRHRRGLPLPGAARALGAVPPRGGAGPARRLADPRALRRGACADAAPRRPRVDLPDRLGADRDRPGVRVRLRRLPGAQGSARGGVSHDRLQLEPGDDHDRPGFRRPHLHRAPRPRERRLRPAPRAPGRPAADARRTDRAQPRGRPRRGRGPGRALRRAHRRAGRGHPPGGGSRALPRRRPLLRARGARVDCRHVAGASAGAASARGRAPCLHAGRARRRLRRGPALPRAPRRARPLGVADRAGARRGVRARLGRVRARGHARPRGQRRDRLLDREPRPDGRAHGRLGHGRAADDALRRGLPGAARRGARDHPRRRRRDRRLEHPVRARAARRASCVSSR